MSGKHNFWLVIGRVCGDDEDTSLLFKDCTHAEAVARFKEDQQSRYPDTDWELEEANGTGVFINGVFWSDTPITPTTGIWA